MSGKPDPQKRQAVFSYLQSHFAVSDWVPTYDEIMTGAKLKSKCQISKFLLELRDEGLVQFEPGKPRTLRMTAKGRSYPKQPKQRVAGYVSRVARINAAAVERTVSLRVMGRTFAGKTTPIPDTDLSRYDEFSTVEISEDMLPSPSKRQYYFLLEVSGDSMIEAKIYDGDYIICRKTETAQNGEMVVALLTDTNETTLKYFFHEGNQIRLQPANSAMQPILIQGTENLIIQGVVVNVVHCYGD